MRILMIGFGNLASKLAKLIIEAKKGFSVPTIFQKIGKYTVKDIEIAGIVDIRKSVLMKLENERSHDEHPKKAKLMIHPGILLDEAPGFLREIGKLTTSDIKTFRSFLDEVNADIAILSINSFAERSAIIYANLLAEHGISLINTTPIRIAWNKIIAEHFRRNKAAVVGDYVRGYFDLFSLVWILKDSFEKIGFRISETNILERVGGIEGGSLQYYLNKISNKMQEILAECINAVESTYTIDWRRFLQKEKLGSLLIDITNGLCDVEISISAKFDASTMASLTLIDVIRATKVSIEQGYSGNLDIISSYGFIFVDNALRHYEEIMKRFREFVSRFSDE